MNHGCVSRLYLMVALTTVCAGHAQTWQGTSTPTTTGGYNTSIQLTYSGYGAHQALLFNAYRDSENNFLFANGITKYNFDAGPYSNGAGALMFVGNGGRMDFMISPASSGAGNNVDWGSPKMTITRAGYVGINNNDPRTLLHIGSGGMGWGTALRMVLEPPQHTGADWEFTVRDDQSYSYYGFGYGAENFTFSNEGRLGIGTTYPTAKLEVNGDANIGSNIPSAMNYGAKLNFLGADGNGDALWISRYNNGSNQSQLRVNIGDDYGQHEDMFVIGTHHWNGQGWFPHLVVQASGRVGIGIDNPDSKLAVNGDIHATEVRVTTSVPGPDYVFEDSYDLRPLEEVRAYIAKNHHLPEIQSAKEMEANGVKLGEMNMMLLKKIEELTLYIIQQEERIKSLEKKK